MTEKKSTKKFLNYKTKLIIIIHYFYYTHSTVMHTVNYDCVNKTVSTQKLNSDKHYNYKKLLRRQAKF